MFLLHLPCLYMFSHPQQGMCLPASDPELSRPYNKWISVRLVSKRGTELMKCRHSFFFISRTRRKTPEEIESFLLRIQP